MVTGMVKTYTKAFLPLSHLYKSQLSLSHLYKSQLSLHHIAQPITNSQQREKATEFEITRWSAEEVT